MRLDWKLVAAVAAGGAIGSVARFALSSFVAFRVTALFPVGTLLINVVGSFILGVLMQMSLTSTSITPELRLFLTTGLCGGFTTFSTFSYETIALVDNGKMAMAGLYVGLSVAVSLIACFLGTRIIPR
jgi:fluoride exporter